MNKMIEKIKERREFVEKGFESELERIKSLKDLLVPMIGLVGEISVYFRTGRTNSVSRVLFKNNPMYGPSLTLYAKYGEEEKMVAFYVIEKGSYVGEMSEKAYEILSTLNKLIDKDGLLEELTRVAIGEKKDMHEEFERWFEGCDADFFDIEY